jgi:hypothetical protein
MLYRVRVHDVLVDELPVTKLESIEREFVKKVLVGRHTKKCGTTPLRVSYPSLARAGVPI